MGFEIGHQLSTGPKKPRYVFDGLVREVVQNPEKLKAALASVLDQAAAGDVQALDWISCKLEGKPQQSVTHDATGTLQDALRRIALQPVPDVLTSAITIESDDDTSRT